MKNALITIAVLVILLFWVLPRLMAAEHPVPLEKDVTDAKCLECHNNDTGRQARASNNAPSGPHASPWPHILERQNTMASPPASPGIDGTRVPYSPTNYSLCNKCHQVEEVINANLDSFSKHREHIAQTPCSTCHDPHASQYQHLINFDKAIVDNSLTSGAINWSQTATGGTCTLMCHGYDHAASVYTFTPALPTP